jgi:predicted DNA-binding transcriptional regulator YafY
MAVHFGVSKNTVLRDIDHLSSAGVCVAEDLVGTTIRYQLKGDAPAPTKAGSLSPATAAAITAALRPWRRTTWFRELMTQLHAPHADSSFLDSSSPEPVASGGALMLREVTAGLLQHRYVRVTYRSRGTGRAEHRFTIEPVRLRVAAGLSYLDAHVVPSGEVRTLALHRIVDARASKKTFEPRVLPRRTAFGAFEGVPVEAVVRFAAPVAEFIRERRWHPSQRLEAMRDGGVVWRGRVSGEHEFVGWVMSWSPWAELVSPPEWRRNLRARSRRVTAAHG